MAQRSVPRRRVAIVPAGKAGEFGKEALAQYTLALKQSPRQGNLQREASALQKRFAERPRD